MNISNKYTVVNENISQQIHSGEWTYQSNTQWCTDTVNKYTVIYGHAGQQVQEMYGHSQQVHRDVQTNQTNTKEFMDILSNKYTVMYKLRLIDWYVHISQYRHARVMDREMGFNNRLQQNVHRCFPSSRKTTPSLYKGNNLIKEDSYPT